MIDFRNMRVNPLSVISAVLFILAPFFSWITVSAFGLTAEATLLDVASSKTPLSIPPALPQASLLATILLVVGGLILPKIVRVGLPVATAGLALFLLESYSLFGSPVSVIPIVVAPGIGLLTALVSIGVGAASFRVRSQELKTLVRKLSTRQGLTGIGLYVATFSLVLDGLNHAVLGELSAFLGTGVVEPVFHLGLLSAIFLLVFIFSVRKEFQSLVMDSALIIAAFAFIILDAAYHILTGGASGFVGHDSTEIILHVSTYYGTAFLLISRFFKG